MEENGDEQDLEDRASEVSDSQRTTLVDLDFDEDTDDNGQDLDDEEADEDSEACRQQDCDKCLNPLLTDLYADFDEGEGSGRGRRAWPKEVVFVQKLLPITQPTMEREGQMRMGGHMPQKKPLAFAAEAEDRVIDYSLYFSKQFET